MDTPNKKTSKGEKDQSVSPDPSILYMDHMNDVRVSDA